MLVFLILASIPITRHVLTKMRRQRWDQIDQTTKVQSWLPLSKSFLFRLSRAKSQNVAIKYYCTDSCHCLIGKVY